jgi:hypothetical protein
LRPTEPKAVEAALAEAPQAPQPPDSAPAAGVDESDVADLLGSSRRASRGVLAWLCGACHHSGSAGCGVGCPAYRRWSRRRGRCARAMRFVCGDVMFTIYMQTLLHFTVIGMAEMYPLYAADDAHGLGFSPGQIGASMLPLGVVLLLAPFTFPTLNRRLGTVNCFRFGLALFCVVNLAYPVLRAVRETWPARLVASAGVVSAFRGIGGPVAFGSISLLMNNLLKSNLGLMNGLATSFAAGARALAPFACGSLWAGATISHAAFPFDFHAPFYTLALVAVLALAFSTRFKDQRKQERPAAEST